MADDIEEPHYFILQDGEEDGAPYYLINGQKRYMYYNMEGKPISIKEYGKLMSNIEKRRVAKTTLDDGTEVSTVLLAIDHSFDYENTRPVIFETMVFNAVDPEDEDYQVRYHTLEEAELGHEVIVEIFREKERNA